MKGHYLCIINLEILFYFWFYFSGEKQEIEKTLTLFLLLYVTEDTHPLCDTTVQLEEKSIVMIVVVPEK